MNPRPIQSPKFEHWNFHLCHDSSAPVVPRPFLLCSQRRSGPIEHIVRALRGFAPVPRDSGSGHEGIDLRA
jgi:hypothetical protein